MLRVSPKAVYKRAITDRTFPAVKFNGKVRINRARLVRWLDRQHPAAGRARTRNPKVAAHDAPANTAEDVPREAPVR
jgi:hypothetical protein